MLNTITKSILDLQDIQNIKPDLIKVASLPMEGAKKIESIIFDGEKTVLYIISTNNFPDGLNKLIENLTTKGFKPQVFYTDTESFKVAMGWYDIIKKEHDQKEQVRLGQLNAVGVDAESMIKKMFDDRNNMDDGDFIMEIIRLAFQTGASDLHFQPEQTGVFMRIRKDGILKQILHRDTGDFTRYLQKLKFISGVRMNIDYIPQDGRFDFMVNINGQQKKIDVRINFMPGLRLESVVMRFLDGSRGIQTFSAIGFSDEGTEIIKRNVAQSYGMILMTGPTGSGKTTTLYSMLNTLNDGAKKIITLEDPVEYEVNGFQQSQINYKKGYDYAEGLKAILRHDPEVILVGEIRELETAQIAINAALTGHLVFSTLHTNSAIETLSRLVSMGVQAYMLAPALRLIVGQRLVRKLCHCATKRPATYAEAEEINLALKKIKDVRPSIKSEFDGNVRHPVGCPDCNNDGYKGRIAITELFELNDELKKRIIDGANALDIYAKAREMGYITMYEDGLIKAINGSTTLDELRRVV